MGRAYLKSDRNKFVSNFLKARFDTPGANVIKLFTAVIYEFL
jgi:hypothetical protein